MISSVAVALTDREFHPQLIKKSSHFVLKASRKIVLIISKIKQIFINLELEAVSKQIESVELISVLQNSWMIK